MMATLDLTLYQYVFFFLFFLWGGGAWGGGEGGGGGGVVSCILDDLFLIYSKFNISRSWPTQYRYPYLRPPKTQWLCLFFVTRQSDHLFMRYSKSNIWPWKFKDRVSWPRSNFMALYRSHVPSMSLFFVSCQWDPCLPEIKQIQYLTLKNQGQGHIQGQNCGSHFRRSVQSKYLLFVSWQSNNSFTRYS